MVQNLMSNQGECYNPKKEQFLAALVWLQLFSLPEDLLDLEILKGIGNPNGDFVKISKITTRRRNESYMRIYFYVDISKPLSKQVDLEYYDEIWTQPLD